MVMLTLIMRLIFLRARFFLYMAFIFTTAIFFYWLSGGFVTRSSNPAAIKSTITKRENKIDTNYPPLVRRYCNYPITNFSHDAMDNAGHTNLQLRGLLVMTRHGDRAPLLPFPQHLNVPRCGLRDADDIDLFHRYRSEMAQAAANVVPVDRSASSIFTSFLTAPPNERCRPGHLTAIGAVQMIRLGRRLRDHYRNTWSFPSKSTECTPRSTVYPRTYQSALAFLHGWTTPIAGDKDKDRKIDREQIDNQKCNLRSVDTTFFCGESWCMCPNRVDAYRREYHQRLAAYTKTETKDKDIRSIVQKIGAVLETPKLEDPVSAFDTMMGYACHQEALPCNNIESKTTGGTPRGKQNVCVTKDWLIKLWNEAKNSEAAATKSDSAKNLFKVESAPILARLSAMSDELASAEKSIFEYYSGHDVSLRPLLSILGVWDFTIPPYASYLAFELVEDTSRKTDKEKPSMYFRVKYNGDDVTQKISPSFCTDSIYSRYNEAVFKLCNINGLKEYSKKFVNVLANGEKEVGDDWVKLCR